MLHILQRFQECMLGQVDSYYTQLDDYLYNVVGRRMSEGEEEEQIIVDYSVCSVAFMTLLILIGIELIRDYLDEKAVERPFLKAILETVYAELSTVGTVEFFVFILAKIIPHKMHEIEPVFKKVHFMLFFITVLDALSTCLIAFITTHISTRMWVKSEEMEMDYYLGLRTEFDLLAKELERRGIDYYHSVSVDEGKPPGCCSSITTGLKHAWVRIRHPVLAYKYKKLLLPIRFHDFRMHFLKANDLPKTFRISLYLKRNELDVLKKLAKIHMFAWLSLLAAFNVAYYGLGLAHVDFHPEDNPDVMVDVIEIGLVCICGSIVIGTLIIWSKLKCIFREIISTNLINLTADENDDSITKRNLNQLELFWDENPQIIIALLQVMQFMYALLTSFLIIFWDTNISPAYDSVNAVPPNYLILTVALSYLIFILCTATMLPLYTLTTNLGQLVNKRILAETLALWKLETLKEKRALREKMKRLKSMKAKERGSAASAITDNTDGSGNAPVAEHKDHEKAFSWFSANGLALFMHTKAYRFIDFVLGTMITFFFVGLRMEHLLSNSGFYISADTIFLLTANHAFALELMWLIQICFVNILILFLFACNRSLIGRITIIIAALLDLAVSGTCLGLLVCAELERCCLPFGENVGLGKIEPWTGLILLRSFRHFLARKIYKGCCKGRRVPSGTILDVKHDGHDPHHGKKHEHELTEETGTILELWNTAVGLHPDIAKEYGEFSSEMLQAMLGIPVKKKHKKTKKPSDAETKEPEEQEDTKTESVEIQRKYKTLSGAVQAVIAAGKLGKAVTIVEPTHDASNSALNSSQETLLVTSQARDNEEDQELLAPNARLICELRRCQRKLLPMLPNWVIVDVALSKYEMVLMDASGGNKAVFDALVATGGGKGLRMCDVIAGRGIVGRVNVSEVTCAMVERMSPSDHVQRKQQGMKTDKKHSEAFHSEYWKVDSTVGSSIEDISCKWEHVTEDRCKIVFGKNSLYLRFFADLVPKRDDTPENQRHSEALSWCQTIVRICGPEQLHLPSNFDINKDLIVRAYFSRGLLREATQRFLWH